MITLQNAVDVISGKQQEQMLYLRSIIANKFPIILSALRLVDHEYTAVKRHKGYNLVKRDSKKLGFVYYVRYWHKGSMLSSKWCTHTNIYEEACKFAEENRERLISRYLTKTGGDAVRFFKEFYDLKNAVYQSETIRNGEISEKRRKRYKSMIENKFIPFLKARKISAFEEITTSVLDDFQDIQLAEGARRNTSKEGDKTKSMKAQSVNDDMLAVRKVFKYMIRKGMVKNNPFQNLLPVPERQEDKKTHGCYELDLMRGIFEKRWKDKKSYLLNLIIYTTDMRNSEIKSFSKSDIISILGVQFIDLKMSKTKNGERLIPLHKKVYKKIQEYAAGIDKDTPIFGDTSCHQFSKAYKELGKMLKVTDEFLEKENIKFYSGRHFWKTLMNANKLGEEAEERFMGHKVSGDVSKLYNHRDKQGKESLVKKAKEIFKILETKLFIK